MIKFSEVCELCKKQNKKKLLLVIQVILVEGRDNGKCLLPNRNPICHCFRVQTCSAVSSSNVWTIIYDFIFIVSVR